METMKVWNVWSEDPDDPDCHREFVGTFASIERARREISELHPGATTAGALIASGGYVVVDSSDVRYYIQRTEVQS